MEQEAQKCCDIFRQPGVKTYLKLDGLQSLRKTKAL